MSYGLVAAGIGAAANVYGASQAAGAAGDAAQAQQEAIGQARTDTAAATRQAREDLAPYMKSGVASNSRLDYLLGNSPYDKTYAQQKVKALIAANGFPDLPENWLPDDKTVEMYLAANPDFAGNGVGGSLTKKFSTEDLNADPVYQSGLQFGLDQGTKAINARATATGNFDSGATLKALTQYGNDYGSTKANDSFNRDLASKQSIYGMLSGQQATGLGATNSANSIGISGANTQADLSTQAGNSRAAGIVGGANAWGGVGNSINSAYNNYNNNSILQKLLAPKTGGTTYAGSTSLPNYSSGIDSSGMY